MPDNVAASMTASIVLDKSDLLAQILKGLSEGQKELQNNKLEMYFDFSNSKNQAEFEKVIQKYRKQLSSQEFVVQIKDQGIDETVKSLDKLVEVVKSLASGKAFGTGLGNGKGIGNSIVDEKQLKTVINLFEKMESHLGSMRKVISDVGDGDEFSPLLTMINRIDSSISELAKKTSNLSLNMNLDFGSDDKITAEVQSRTAKLLHTYENLFNRLKMSGTLDSNMQGYFDNFDINQYDNMNAKIAAYKNFITEMREMSKQQFGKDYLYSDIEKSYYSAVSGAQRSLNNVIKSESTSNNSIENLFGKTDLSEVISQLTIIVNKLDEISTSANNFTNVFKNGLDVNTSIQEVIDLTNRVKELETELAKIKNVTPATVSPASETNISLGDSSTTSTIDKQLSSTKKLIDEEEKLSNIQNKIISFKPQNNDAVINEKTEETLQKSSEYASELLETAQQIIRLANNNVGFVSSEDATEIEKLYQLFPELKDFRYNDMSLDFMSKSDLDEGWMDAFMDFSATLPKAAEYFEMIDEFSSHLSDDGRFWGNEQDFAKDFLHVDPDALDRIAEVNNALNEALGTEEDYTSKYKEIGQQLKDGSIDIQDAIRDILQLEFPNNKIMETPDGVWVAPEKLNKTTKSIKDVSSAVSDVSNKVLQFPGRNVVSEQDKIQEELQQTQDEIDSTQSKYQSLLDVAKKQLDDDKGTNYYSGKTTETKAFDNFTFNEQAKRSSHFDVWSKDYEELCSLMDKTEEELKSGSIGFDEAIDRMVAAYQKYDTATKIDVGGFDFLDGVENVPSVLSDTEKAVLNENKAIKESEYTLQDYINTYLELKKVKESSLSVDPKITGVTSNGRPIIKDGSDESFKAELMMKDMESEVLQIYGKDLSALADEHIKASESAKEHAKAENQVTQAIKESSSTASQNQTKDAFPDKDVSASVDTATNSIKEENNVLEQNTQKVKENTQAKEQNANIDFSKYDKRLDSYNGKIDKYKTTIDRFNDGGWTSDAYLKNVQAVKNAVNEYETLLKELKGKDASLVTSEDISKLDNYEKKIKDTIATVTNMSAAEKGYNFVSGQKELDKIHKLLAENSKMSSEAKAKIKAYYAEIESGNPSMSLDKIHGEILKIYNAEVEAGRAGRTLLDTLKNSGFHQIAAQMAGMVGVYDVINGLKQVASTIRELDTAYTEMRKVSDESAQSLKNFQKESFSTADSVGTTALAMQDATATWMRLGESLDEAKESAKDATVLLNVSEFDNIDEATDSLVAMSQAYKDLDKMEIIDVLDKIGNEYSISTDQLSTALKDSAAVLKTQGNDLAESVALITAGNAITQDASKTAGETLPERYRNIFYRTYLTARAA